MAGTLSIVATPIGNLEDISARALRVLKESDLIAADDTRQTQKLLTRYAIEAPLTSYHEHNVRRKTAELVSALLAGKNIALVTDAGTPGISDPGRELAEAAIQAHVPITSLPGPSACLVALTLSGLPSDRFCFEGFLSSSPKMRRRRLRELAGETRTMVFYEAPHRIAKTVSDMTAIFGDDRKACLARELTKVYEEVRRGTLGNLLEIVISQPQRGEISLVVQGINEQRGGNHKSASLTAALAKRRHPAAP